MRKTWTESEENLLKEYWPDKGSAFCKNILGRTKTSIKCKAKKLGLKRNYSPYRANTRKYNCYERYGITPDQYDALFESQKGCCAICGRVETESNEYGVKRLCVDHCHYTGKVRGLLCRRCNTLIGFADADVNILEQGIKYLNDFDAAAG